MTEGCPLRIFKWSKKEFMGLKVALIKIIVFIHKVLETIMIIDTLFT